MFSEGKSRLQHAIKFVYGIPKQNLSLLAYSLLGAYCWNPHTCLHKKLPQTYIYNYLKMCVGGAWGAVFHFLQCLIGTVILEVKYFQVDPGVNPHRLGTEYLAPKHLAPSVKFKTWS